MPGDAEFFDYELKPSFSNGYFRNLAIFSYLFEKYGIIDGIDPNLHTLSGINHILNLCPGISDLSNWVKHLLNYLKQKLPQMDPY